MFTGIVETTAEVREKSATGLVLARPAMFDDVTVGSSISVSGACLTIAKIDQQSLQFDVVQETWDRTKLGSLLPGDHVNLERALAANGRFEGHVVQGHVEGVGRVVSFLRSESSVGSVPASPQAPSPRSLRSHPFERPSPPSVPNSSLVPSPRSLRSHPFERPSPPSVPPLPGGEGGRGERGEYRQRAKTLSHVLRYARMMRKAPTPCEKLLWHELRSLRHRGFIFRRQHVMGRFILDFYCHEARLGIEIDGSSHDSIHRQRDDADRSVFLEEMRGIHLLRFTNQEILADLPSVLDRIQQAAASTQPADAPWYSALLTVELPPELLPFVVFKGSITLDGVALTVAKLEQKMCTIALIPHTLAVTTLGELQEGSVLNVETDVLGRYVAAMLHRSSPVHHEA